VLIQNPSLKPQRDSNADVTAQWPGKSMKKTREEPGSNRSGFHNCRQNSRNWVSSLSRWTRDGDSQELSGQVFMRHDPRAQVLREGGEREMGELEGVYLRSQRTPDNRRITLDMTVRRCLCFLGVKGK
jgi:hypothetical protein